MIAYSLITHGFYCSLYTMYFTYCKHIDKASGVFCFFVSDKTNPLFIESFLHYCTIVLILYVLLRLSPNISSK